MKCFKQWSDMIMFAFKKGHPDDRLYWKETGVCWERGRGR